MNANFDLDFKRFCIPKDFSQQNRVPKDQGSDLMKSRRDEMG